MPGKEAISPASTYSIQIYRHLSRSHFAPKYVGPISTTPLRKKKRGQVHKIDVNMYLSRFLILHLLFMPFAAFRKRHPKMHASLWLSASGIVSYFAILHRRLDSKNSQADVMLAFGIALTILLPMALSGNQLRLFPNLVILPTTLAFLTKLLTPQLSVTSTVRLKQDLLGYGIVLLASVVGSLISIALSKPKRSDSANQATVD